MMKRLALLAAIFTSSACAPNTGAVAPKPAAEAAQLEPSSTQSVDVPLLKSDWTPEALTKECERVEHVAQAKLDAIAKPTADGLRSFADTFGALEAATAEYGDAIARLTFMKEVHTDAKVRGAGSACEERAGKFMVQVGARKDLYDAMQVYLSGKVRTGEPALDQQDKRLIEVTMQEFKKNGLDLPDAKRNELTNIRKRLAELETKFATNLGEDETHFEVAISELDGLPQEFVDRHQKSKDGKKVVLTTKYPDYYPVLENAKNEAVRRQMETAFQRRGGEENLKLLDEAVQLRAKAAALLGFPTHVDFVAQDRMAKDAKTISAFLERLRAGLAPGLAKDTEKMLAKKRAETKDPKAQINAWDWRYYMNRIRQEEYAIDDEEVRNYFPVSKVMAGLFGVYEKLFSIDLREVPAGTVWADGVKLYEVHDVPSGRLVAKFYVDMYPREGKYGHAAEFSMSMGHEVEGGYRIPLSCLVVNFNPPQNGKEAHLSLEEVETLFHEFGHVVHDSLTTARYVSISGTNTARDFVEAPSQMLENWVYQPEVLAMLSQDPQDPQKAMPEDLMQRIAKARYYNAGIFYSRQVFLSLFDYAIHTHADMEVDATAKRLWAEIIGFPEDKDAHFAGTFGHMMGGYDGGYYGYLWSKVFATDMFTRFQKEGILNSDTGRAYRDIILAKGRTVAPDVLLEQFLGRKPNEKAFLAQLGIKEAPARASR